jgi:hypothetical protein
MLITVQERRQGSQDQNKPKEFASGKIGSKTYIMAIVKKDFTNDDYS